MGAPKERKSWLSGRLCRIYITGCANAVLKCLPCPPADPTNQLAQLVCGTLAGIAELGQQPCSADDIAKGRFVEAAFPQNSSFCAAGPALNASGLATSVSCCNDKNLCNTPSMRCYQGVDSKVALQSVASRRCVAPRVARWVGTSIRAWFAGGKGSA
jgi:hypothetical protein